MLEEEFRGLMVRRDLPAHRLLDDAWSREADTRVGLSEDYVGRRGMCGCDSAITWIAQHGNMRLRCVAEVGEGHSNFRHLQQRQNALLHSGAAGRVNRHKGYPCDSRILGRARNLFPNNDTHRTA